MELLELFDYWVGMRGIAFLLIAFIFAFAHSHRQSAVSPDSKGGEPLAAVADYAAYIEAVPTDKSIPDPNENGCVSIETAICLADCIAADLSSYLEPRCARPALADWQNRFQPALHIERRLRPPKSA